MARAIDADEFMKRLILDTSKGFYGEYMDGSDTAYTFREIDRFVDEMPTLTPPNEWVSVEDRLPEQENTQVLMTDGECHYISSRNNMVRFLDCEGIFIPGKVGAGVKVTHWMPLPAPPYRRPPEGEEET